MSRSRARRRSGSRFRSGRRCRCSRASGLSGAARRFGGRAVDAALDGAAHRHHQPGGAVVGALAAVLADAPAELGELQHERVVEQALVLQVGVEREAGRRSACPSARRRHRSPGSCSDRHACRSRRSGPRTPSCQCLWRSRRQRRGAPARSRCWGRSPTTHRC